MSATINKENFAFSKTKQNKNHYTPKKKNTTKSTVKHASCCSKRQNFHLLPWKSFYCKKESKQFIVGIKMKCCAADRTNSSFCEQPSQSRDPLSLSKKCGGRSLFL